MVWMQASPAGQTMRSPWMLSLTMPLPEHEDMKLSALRVWAVQADKKLDPQAVSVIGFHAGITGGARRAGKSSVCTSASMA
jgi:hypothetical protein